MAPTHAHFSVRSAETRDTALSKTVNWMAQSDPHRTTFDALVLRSTPRWFVLDSTWLEPDRVAAIGDQGWVEVDGGRLPIMRVDPDGAHHLHGEWSIDVGSRVEITIDPDIRRQRTRTAALQNLLRSVLGGFGAWQPVQRTATRVALQQGWADRTPSLEHVRSRLDALIREHHQIWRVVDPADGTVYWQVDGVATIADSSLSVEDTSLVGPFSLRFAESGGRVCIFAETLLS